MSDEPENLILQLLRDIRDRLDNIEHEIVALRADHGRRLESIDAGLQLFGTQLATTNSRLRDFDARLTQIEKV